MDASIDRTEFLPVSQPGRWRALVLAVAAHLVLLGALTLGLRWNDKTTLLTAEAELWSATVQQAAPKLAEAPPPPPPPPTPRVQPAPPPPVPQRDEADIAVEREKKRQAEEKRRQEEAAERERERERERKLEAEKAQKEKAERERAEREKAEARRKELAEQKRAEERKQRELAEKARQREQQEAQRVAQLREENMRRIQGLAGATGAPSATGTAQRSSGPSDSYAGRIRARVKPNIVFADDVAGNPTAEVEVRMAPDGTITSRKITKSSGVKSWDEAVLRALDRTEVLPRDVDGRVHSPLLMEFRPKG